jgi:hypothetical protein
VAGGRLWVKRVESSPLWAVGATYFSPALVEHAKAVPGIFYESATKSWRGYADAVTAVVARLSLKNITVDGRDELPDPESWRTARTPFLFSTSDLRDYQVEGVRFLLARSKEGALLADGMRLGKSCQSLITARAFKQKTLIVCPSHAVGVWGRAPKAVEGPGEIAKWWPDAWKPATLADGSVREGDVGVVCLETVKPFAAQKVVRELSVKSGRTKDEDRKLAAARAEIESRALALDSANVIVCHYDILYAWVDVLLAWGLKTFIVDEIHVCAGYQSRRSNALKELRAGASHFIGLTGTPVTNLPKNLHNVLEMLAPGRFGYFFTGARPGCYAKLFCDYKVVTVGKGPEQITINDFSGRSNIDEPDGKLALTQEETLQARLKFLHLRRLKKDVDPQLPQKQRQIIDVAIPARHVIAVSDRMLAAGGGELRRCLDLAADAKIKSVVSIVADHIAEGEKVICFCYRRLFSERVCDDVTRKVSGGTGIEFVHGGMTQKERDKRIHRVRMHEGPAVLACTIDTTSTSIDLSFASVAVVAELSWEWHELAQVEERLYKFSAETKYLIQYIIARGTGDELILRSIINKLDLSERLVGKTGDKMKEELGTRKEDPMKRLFAALAEMQKGSDDGPPTGVVKRKKGKK